VVFGRVGVVGAVVVVLALAGCGTAPDGGLVSAGPSLSPEQQFVREVRQHVAVEGETDRSIIDFGLTVCTRLAAGDSVDKLVGVGLTFGFTEGEMKSLIGAARSHIC
jgi:hypothetical protein